MLEDGSVGINLWRLIQVFWEMAIFCCQAGGNHRRLFRALYGMTRGCPLLPKLFNITADAIVQELMRQVMGCEVAVEGVALEIRKMLVCTYVDNRIIAACGPVRQCRPSEQHHQAIHNDLSPRQHQGVLLSGDVQKEDERTAIKGTRRHIPCKKCGAVRVDGSIQKNIQIQYDVFNLYFPLVITSMEGKEPHTFSVHTKCCPINYPSLPTRNF
jgi:hypothetical protein